VRSLRAHWIAVLAGVALLTAALVGSWASTCGYEGCPSAAQILAFRPTEGSRVLDRNGASLGRLTAVRRVNVPLSRVPKAVRAAFIAVEDRRFYHHHGIDWHAAGRAFWRNAEHLSVREGFSTLTMQAARSAFLPGLSDERSLRRKVIELVLARRLEHTLTKQQILELYLNVIYLGDGTYGVEAASRNFFGKSVNELTLAEAATLAALPRSPAGYDPRRHPDRAEARRNLVLSLMQQQGLVTEEQADEAKAEPLEVAEDTWRPPTPSSYALEPVRAFVDSVLSRKDAPLGDITVHTTFDAQAQRAAELAVRAQAAAIQRSAGGDGEVQGALVALDPATGAVRALVGGRSLERGAFDRSRMARRQPGSAFKPFVYLAALESGFTPATIVDDTPVEVEEHGRVWQPANFGDDYAGPVTLRHALMRSANAATVRVSEAVGERKVVDMAHRLGVASDLPAVPSIALGSAEVTPIELVTAYAPLANGGKRVRPWMVTRIDAADGTVLWKAKPPEARPVLDPGEAFQVTSMLESAVDEGTGRVIRELGVRGPVAGKTGTTNNGADVWFVGYTPTIVAGVWFGYDSPKPLAGNASGGRLAAPAWATFYLRGWRERGEAWLPPPTLVSREIDDSDGLLANQWCPTTRREWFRRGTEPTRVCDIHQEPLVEGIRDLGRALGRLIRKALKL
jgi:penicillin-binding protein 1A